MLEFFQMGGYAAYVWPSFVLTFVVLWLNWWLASRRHQTVIRSIRRRNALNTESEGASFREVSS